MYAAKALIAGLILSIMGIMITASAFADGKSAEQSQEEAIKKLLSPNACLILRYYHARHNEKADPVSSEEVHLTFRDVVFEIALYEAAGKYFTEIEKHKSGACYTLGGIMHSSEERVIAVYDHTKKADQKAAIKDLFAQKKIIEDYCGANETEDKSSCSETKDSPKVSAVKEAIGKFAKVSGNISEAAYKDCEEKIKSIPEDERTLPPVLDLLTK